MITLDALDRDILAEYAAGVGLSELQRRWQRRHRIGRLMAAVSASRAQAGRLVAVYDQLAARPVGELSPLRRPARVLPEPSKGRAPACVLNEQRKERPTWQ